MSGAPEIDQQHRELVSLLDSLNNAVRSQAPRDDIYRIIDLVISFTSMHFAAEEYLMNESGYPEIEAHKDKHRQLIQDALRFRAKLDRVGDEPFLEWFQHWPFANILAHIQYADNQVRDHIIQGSVRD